MAAFRAAMEIGAGIECDVRLTEDDKVVIFHDHDLRRLCASALTVEATSAEVLSHQQIYDSGEHIPLLAELLDLVGGRVPMLIELKCRGGNAARLSNAVDRLLGMDRGPAAVMSFEPAVGKWFARHRPDRRRGLVISERASALDRWRSIARASPDFLAVDVGAINRPWVARQRASRRIYCWTIRTADQRAAADIYADAPIWEGDGRPGS